MTAKIVVMLLLFAAGILGQQRGTYWVEQETVLAGGLEAVTVHMPTGTGRTARFTGASVYCTVACSFVLERDGSAPTSTAAAIKKSNRNEQTPVTAAFHTSNVGVPARTLPKNYVPAASTFVIGLEDNEILEGDNLTIRVGPITGTAKVMITWKEF